MLEALADFWKPTKKAGAPLIKSAELQIGSTVGFGFVPQTTLSGRRFTVTAINTYKFGDDTLTSFVLSQEKDAGASMIIAESDEAPYIAISRRISISDRNKLFSHEELEAIISNENTTTLTCKEPSIEYKGWLVSHYSRSMRGMRGQLFKGDYRGVSHDAAQSHGFAYTLLVSGDDEHALEIEKYDDGRIEVYATVYRRMADVGEVSHPAPKESARAEVKLVSNVDTTIEAPTKPEPKLQADESDETLKNIAVHKAVPVWHKEAPKPEVTALPAAKAIEPTAEEPKSSDVKNDVATSPITLPEFSADAVAKKAIEDMVGAPTVAVSIKSITQPYIKQEIKAVTKEISNFVSESIDCELQVANRIIDEAIRNEMRINDVVRRVIGLPVSQQESVQIPITLTDQDYSLLAIRYGISSSDRDAIKRRITEDLGDFSGANKKKAA